MFTVAGAIKFLQAIGPITAALPDVKNIWDGIVKTFKSDADQKTLQDAYRELQAENAGGHQRLQEMLRKAEQE